jgi:hypothetical protein
VRPYVVRPAAARDIRSAYVWYEGEREGLGEEFLVEVRAQSVQFLTRRRHTRLCTVRRAAGWFIGFPMASSTEWWMALSCSSPAQ